MRKFLIFLACRVLYGVLYGLYRTYRFVPLNENHRQIAQHHHPKGAYLLTCWHEHLVGASLAQVGHPFRPLASRSPSGRVMGYVLEKFGFTMVWGSQRRGNRDKGGAAARAELLEVCAQGYPSAYTVDGSTGPRRQVKPGVVDLARKSGAAILPVACAASRQWVLPTWDLLKIPKPFARIAVEYGTPILIPPNLDHAEFEAYLLKVGDAINACEAAAAAHLQVLLPKEEPTPALQPKA